LIVFSDVMLEEPPSLYTERELYEERISDKIPFTITPIFNYTLSLTNLRWGHSPWSGEPGYAHQTTKINIPSPSLQARRGRDKGMGSKYNQSGK
jgi:hypothetical protein